MRTRLTFGIGLAAAYDLLLGNMWIHRNVPEWIGFVLPPVWDDTLDLWTLRPILWVLVVGAALAWSLGAGDSRRGLARPVLAVTVASVTAQLLWMILLVGYDPADSTAPNLYITTAEVVVPLFEAQLTGLVLGLATVVARRSRWRMSPLLTVPAQMTGAGPLTKIGNWPLPAENTEATRQLCGAAYQRPWFARLVIDELLCSDLQAVAPSPGVSTALVLRHCLTARRWRRDLDVRLSVVLAAGVVLTPLTSWLLLLCVPASAALVVRHRYALRRLIRERFSSSTFADGHGSPDPVPAWAAARVAAVEEAEQGNVTVFSGYRAFIGFGSAESSWSLALPVRPPRELISGRPKGDVLPFTAAELTESVRARVEALADRPGVGTPLTGISVRTRVFADGSALDERLLPEPLSTPFTVVDDSQVAEIASRPEDALRCYLIVEVPSWGGLVVSSIFLRFSTNGHMLFTECERTVTRPIGSNLRLEEQTSPAVDDLDVVGQVLAAILPSAWMMVAAPFGLLGWALDRQRFRTMWEQEHDRAVDERNFDYGSTFSVREAASAVGFYSQFQLRDTEKHLRLVERHVLEAVIDFLEAHEVDTSELRDRQNAILNEGVIQTGGTSNVGALAVGRGPVAATRVDTGAS
jgi:hypothetical protein